MTGPKLEARWIREDDAPALAKLAKAAGFVFLGMEIDWASAAPYWLGVEREDVLVAALQVVAAQPMGKIDYLMVDPSLPLLVRTRVVVKAIDTAQDFLRRAGCQLVASYIAPDRNDDYLSAARERGWVERESVVSLWRRLR